MVRKTMLSQRQVVLFPVADLVNGLTYLVLSEAALLDQIVKVADSSLIWATRLEQGGTKGKTKDALEY